MIFTKKILKIDYDKTSNPLSDMRDTLINRKSYNENKRIVPVYFSRYIGLLGNQTDIDYVRSIEELISFYNKEGINYAVFVDRITSTKTPSEILNALNNINSKYKTLELSDIDSYLYEIINSNVIKKHPDSYISATIEYAYINTIHRYIEKEPYINVTKTKNFAVKLLTWCVGVLPNLIKGFTLRSKYNPKTIYIGSIKKHEIYFLSLLSQLGSDVLYINPDEDLDSTIAYESTVVNNPTHRKVSFKNLVNTAPEKTVKASQHNQPRPLQTNKPQTDRLQTSRPQPSSINTTRINTTRIKHVSIDKVNIIKLKDSSDLFKDCLNPLSNRIGYISGEESVVPTYFYRLLGCEQSIDSYNNKLYNLNKSLFSLNVGYCMFNGNIKLMTNQDLVNKSKDIWRNLTETDKSDAKKIVDLLYSYDCISITNNKTFNNTYAKAIMESCIDLLKAKPNYTMSQLKNFILKLITWAQEYVPRLFNTNSYPYSGDYNPKVLYYGDIKKHEALFISLLYKLGCDIIYINTEGNDGFSFINNINMYSKVTSYQSTVKIGKFPEGEVLTRSETVAYRASQEIGEIIHNEEDGVFKPWQFESYMIQPATLKTTYDELYLLWKEAPRFRSGFNIKNGTVHIPNLFCKVSGVHEDIDQFWNEMQSVVNYNLTHFERNLPFTQSNYRDSDIYVLDYLITRDGKLNKAEVKKSSIYTYSYLRSGLQDTMLNKIEQLFTYKGFKTPIDRKLKLRIIKNVLSLDKHIMELINKFDYPFANPKLVIYDKDESMFSIDDIIVILFLNLMCFDIVIFTPTGYNNIERDVNATKYDVHKLQNIKFNLDIPERLLNPNSNDTNKKSKGFWSNFLGI